MHFDSDTPPEPVRTVTLKFIGNSPRYTVVTTIGTSLSTFDPTRMLGMVPGVISPFFIYRMPDVPFYYIENGGDPALPVELAIDYRNSLLIQRGTFEVLMQRFAEYFRDQSINIVTPHSYPLILRGCKATSTPGVDRNTRNSKE
ncbi:MAG: hypothetical protein HYV40_00165 [Candidatus Levybacteria bacterium]|nr:hypothetical protein [Candidatus Levybacteria bacterium]